MDIDATLDQLRDITDELDNPALSAQQAANRAYQLALHFRAMDQWLSTGGFLPRPWAHARINRTYGTGSDPEIQH